MKFEFFRQIFRKILNHKIS